MNHTILYWIYIYILGCSMTPYPHGPFELDLVVLRRWCFASRKTSLWIELTPCRVMLRPEENCCVGWAGRSVKQGSIYLQCVWHCVRMCACDHAEYFTPLKGFQADFLEKKLGSLLRSSWAIWRLERHQTHRVLRKMQSEAHRQTICRFLYWSEHMLVHTGFPSVRWLWSGWSVGL